ncbi:MAG: hypothetical protein JNJ54_04250 [Myxococcaceae bacterium]|nr:hypothetical protein [Myxococcaceae bacterium]
MPARIAANQLRATRAREDWATSASELSGRSIGLFSYDSGSCAEVFAGTVVAGAQARVRALELQQLLDRRRQLSIDEYEAIMRAREEADL